MTARKQKAPNSQRSTGLFSIHAKSPDHLTMLGAFLNKCLTMIRAALRYSPWGDPWNDETPAMGWGF